MFTGNRVSLETILWKVTQGPLYEDLNPDDAAMYAIEAIKHIGAPLVYVRKVSNPIEIEGHKAAMPSDAVHIRGIRFITNQDNYEDNPIRMRYATDDFHESLDCDPEDIQHPLEHPKEYTYVISGGIITTSMTEGLIQVAYEALDTCENGYPLIPDDEAVLRFIEFHIRMRYLEPLWEIGKVSDKVFQYVAQNRDWYVGSAQSKSKIRNVDHLESIMNAVNRLIIPTLAHRDSFKRLGKKETIRRFS